MPQISVIVPVHKVEKYINRCVDSILAQTFTDFELILVDDGSPDNCGAICDAYAQKDSRVVVIHQENGGLSAARNAGIDWAFANSDSEWLAFVDSDDWVHPKYLEALYNAVMETGESISVCGLEGTSGSQPNVDEGKLGAETWDTETFYCKRNTEATVAWNKLYKKECFQLIRYPIGKLHEDRFVTYRILFQFLELAIIDQPLYAYYQNPNSIMRSKWSMAHMAAFEAREGEIAFLKAHGHQKAYVFQIREYISNYLNVQKIVKENCCDAELSRAIKRTRKKAQEFIKELDIRDDADAWIITRMYPRSMWVYWHFSAACNKIRRIVKR